MYLLCTTRKMLLKTYFFLTSEIDLINLILVDSIYIALFTKHFMPWQIFKKSKKYETHLIYRKIPSLYVNIEIKIYYGS